jgi:hypothetical protein
VGRYREEPASFFIIPEPIVADERSSRKSYSESLDIHDVIEGH